MIFFDLPTLGLGLGFREPVRGDLFLHQREVDFLEITADHYFDARQQKQDELELLAEHFTLIPHGLDLSLGSAEGLDSEYAQKFASLINRLNPPWWSEHIAFTRAGGVEIGHLTPLPFSSEAVELLSRNIAKMRELVNVPLILENITYGVTVPGGKMTEAEFLREVLEQTGAGLLLDVTNLHTNALNLGYDPRRFLDELPMERVVQLHFVGGQTQDGVLVDSHSHPTPPEVWSLMNEVVSRAPVKGIILERDENLPPFGELLAETRQAREIGRRHGLWR